MKTFSRRAQILTVIGAAAALGLSACGGSSGGGQATAAQSSGGGGQTVSTATIGGSGTVLVDAQGNALYTPEQEANGKIACTGACESEWVPLTIGDSQQPSASSDVAAKVGTVKRPDGTQQVTAGGRPLYTFVEDGGPGNVTGDGFTDQFDGRTFNWHVMTPSGPSTAAASSSTTTDSGASGGYGY